MSISYIQKLFECCANAGFDPDNVWEDIREKEDKNIKNELINLQNGEIFNKFQQHFDYIIACKVEEGIHFKDFTIKTTIKKNGNTQHVYSPYVGNTHPYEYGSVNEPLDKGVFMKPTPLVFERL